MDMKGCCGMDRKGEDAGYETVRIEMAKNNCHLCDEFAERQKTKPVAVLCCEGACLRGEIARRAANLLCHELAPQKTVRVCLGGAFTKNGGQRNLVATVDRVIALEGCFVNCSSRMMRGVVDGLAPEPIVADRLYEFDRSLYGADEMPEEQIRAHARTVAEKVAAML
ncbi:putative zinc-binding protein [Geomesophilobacter sediminis]|uniref:DGC domain protein n=1 Tax=Geomesophilobacter sediminis TaxID=2798584 RepID=A0A8J7SDE3_9BACT|nr:putative zinc-binding protein [Geomesophilobacter sediminis]MBJ6727769.1 hypothetical protein [Geomesophilobacter sediminis]